MARFPKIQVDCPVKTSLDDFLSEGVCSLCERQVHNIGSMTETRRSEFLAACTTEVCVQYSLPKRHSISAVALSALMMTLPSAAQESSPLQESSPAQENACSAEHVQACGDITLTDELEIVFVGSIKDPSKIEYIDTEEDLNIPELPVTYDKADS